MTIIKFVISNNVKDLFSIDHTRRYEFWRTAA